MNPFVITLIINVYMVSTYKLIIFVSAIETKLKSTQKLDELLSILTKLKSTVTLFPYANYKTREHTVY